MIRTLWRSVAMILLPVALAQAAPETALHKAPMPELPDAVIAQLVAGEVVILEKDADDTPPDGFSYVDVVELVLLHAPWETVYDIVLDGEKHPEFLPYLENATLLDQAGDPAAVLAQRYYWETWFFITSINFETIVLSDRRSKVIQWDLNHYTENDLKHTTGHWWLYPVDGEAQTLLVYHTEAQSAVPLPGILEQYGMEQGVKAILENLRNRVHSGGTWRKGDDPPPVAKSTD